MTLKWLFSIGIVFSCGLVQAQDRKQLPLVTPTDSNGYVLYSDTTIIKNTVPQKDLTDVLKSIFHKKPGVHKSDSLIVKPEYTSIPAIGYTLQSKLVLTLTGNVAFRFDSTTKLSTISASAAYSQNKQFTMPVQSNIWTHNNRYNLVGDIRYFKYPQSTFGLGSDSHINEEDPMDYQFFRFYEVALRNVTGNFFAGVGYIFDYHWAVSHQNKYNFNADSYATYGTAPSTISTGPTLNLLYDSRSNAIHPTSGAYASVQYRTSSRLLGSTANWHSVLIDARKYYHFPTQSNNVIAFWSYNWLVLGGKPPYLDLPATGWDAFGNTGRGYIQGRFRGTKMVYGETEYRFGLTRNGLFGGVVFANAQSFAAGPNTNLQKVQPGYGLGLRVKVNKVSNTNISIDYGFGAEGSKGLFINIGEMF
jgi:outer membrane protein assembly factor BamA